MMMMMVMAGDEAFGYSLKQGGSSLKGSSLKESSLKESSLKGSSLKQHSLPVVCPKHFVFPLDCC